MKRIVATGIVLLSLCSVAEAHRLFGTVTYYGGNDRLCGRRTASGVAFNCGAMTAAHRTLPFGTVPERRPLHAGRSCAGATPKTQPQR